MHHLYKFVIFVYLGFDEDVNETSDVISQRNFDRTAGDPITYTPKNGQARRAMKITEKNKQDYLFRLMTPLCEFDSLLPGNIEIALKIYLTSPERYFTTKTAGLRPKFKILSANLLFELILIKDNLLQVKAFNP